MTYPSLASSPILGDREGAVNPTNPTAYLGGSRKAGTAKFYIYSCRWLESSSRFAESLADQKILAKVSVKIAQDVIRPSYLTTTQTSHGSCDISRSARAAGSIFIDERGRFYDMTHSFRIPDTQLSVSWKLPNGSVNEASDRENRGSIWISIPPGIALVSSCIRFEMHTLWGSESVNQSRQGLVKNESS